MKRATLSAYPTTPTAQPADLTDRLLAGQAETGGAKIQRQPAKTRRASRKPAAAAPLGQAAVPAASEMQNALAAVAAATAALQRARQEAPARYDVALRFRLDALAHHLQQVKEFLASIGLD